MTRNLIDLVVDKISLVSKDKTPAVPKASTSFSIFKTRKKKDFWEKEQIERIKKCKDVLEDLQNIYENEKEPYP